MTYSPSGAGNVHVDQILTQISVGWPNEGFVGENLFPAVPVRKQSDKYYVFGREAWGVEDDIRAPGTIANEIPGLALSTDTYFAQEHALQVPVTDEELDNADSPLQPFSDGTELVTAKIWLGREVAMKTLVHTTANYASGLSTTLSGVNQWNDYANSNPIGDLKTGKRAVHARLFMEPNTAVIPYQVMSQLEDHPDFLERIKYSERGVLTPDIIGAVIGIPNLIVPGVGQNTANPGQAVSLGYLWAKNVVLAWVPGRPGLKTPAFGYEYRWGYGANAMQVDRWREENRKSELVRTGRRYDLKLTALGDPGSADAGKSVAGYLIVNAVA